MFTEIIIQRLNYVKDEIFLFPGMIYYGQDRIYKVYRI
jgi:hypothetical protein